MCKWNPEAKEPESSRWCTHGHTEHEELLNPNAWSRPPVIWCNACWTVCAYQSNKPVRKGALAAISDAFNGTTRAPPYIDQFNERKSRRRQSSEKGTRRHPSESGEGTVPVSPVTERMSDRRIPQTHAMGVQAPASTAFTPMPPAQEGFSDQTMPRPTGLPRVHMTTMPCMEEGMPQPPGMGVLDVPSTAFSAMPPVHERVSGRRMPQTGQVPLSGFPAESFTDEMSEVDDGYPIQGPLQTHNLDMYAEFDEGTEGLK